MEERLQRRVQRYGWDKASPYYEAFWQRQLRPAQELLLEMAGLGPGENVLDVACGTGLVSFAALAELGMHGRVLGTDISEKMLEVACSLAKQINETRMQFERMDAEDLIIENHPFDAALCALGLMYMPNPRKALEQMHRVLKPGGRAVASVWGRREQCGWAELFEIVDRHLASEVCPMFFNLGNADMLERNFKAAGFAGISCRRINTVLFYSNDKEALGAAFEGGPVALAYHKFSDEIKQQVHKDYLASLAPFKKAGGYEVPGEFVVAKAFR